jgi:hypothetical protein
MIQPCGTKVKLKKGGFIEGDKPGIFVEMSHQQRSMRFFMCSCAATI